MPELEKSKTYVVFALVKDLRDRLLEIAFAKVNAKGEILEEGDVRTNLIWNASPCGLYHPVEAIRILQNVAINSVLVTYGVPVVVPVIAPLLRPSDELCVFDILELYPDVEFWALCPSFDNPDPGRALGNLAVMVHAFVMKLSSVKI